MNQNKKYQIKGEKRDGKYIINENKNDFVEIWKFRVVNPDLVPREYLIIDEKKLNEIARTTKGTINIAGIEFYSEKSIRTR